MTTPGVDRPGGRAAGATATVRTRGAEHGGPASAVVHALRFIESHLEDEVCVDDIAAAAGLTRFQLARVFLAATGMSVMHYVRGRRLTQAARDLARGASDILSVALNWGYGSHEAFTRAFCQRFSLTPEALRARGDLTGIRLTQALVTGDIRVVQLDPPRLLHGELLVIAGMRQRFVGETNAAIPMLWQRFVPRMREVRERAGTYSYGVCCNNDHEGGFDYLAGVEARTTAELPADFAHVQLCAQKYAVFIHRGHISGIRATMYSIWTRYLPRLGAEAIEAPDFERYTEAFNPRTGDGDVEIWIPIA